MGWHNHPLGTVVMDETIYTIGEVFLRDGMLHLHATPQEPVAYPGGTTEYQVFGEDGDEVLRVSDFPMFQMTLQPGEVIDFTVRYQDKTGWPVEDGKKVARR